MLNGGFQRQTRPALNLPRFCMHPAKTDDDQRSNTVL